MLDTSWEAAARVAWDAAAPRAPPPPPRTQAGWQCRLDSWLNLEHWEAVATWG